MLLIWRKVISLCWLRKPIMDHQITAVSLKKHPNLSYLFKQRLAKMKAGKLFLQTITLVFIRLFLLGYTFMTTWQPWHALKNRFACSKWTNVTYILYKYIFVINSSMFVCAAGSKSDGQKSPSDSVFLRMDEIPYIREDRAETDTHTGTTSKYICKQLLSDKTAGHNDTINHFYQCFNSM